MGSKLKAVGAVLLAALAMQAMVASAAQAEFQSSSTHTILSMVQSTFQEFTPAKGVPAIRCNVNGGYGTLSAKANEDVTLSPEITLCLDTFGRAVFAHGTMTYTFTTDGTLHRVGDATYTVIGNKGLACTVTTTSQANNGIAYENLGGTSGIKITTNQTNLVSTITGGLFNCGVKNGEYVEGTYTGASVLTGKDTAGNPVELNKLP